MKNRGEKNLFFFLLEMFFILFLVALQIFIIVFLFHSTKEISLYMDILFNLIRVGAVLYIMYKKMNPAYRIAWIILLMLFPVSGLLFFLLFGNNKMPKRVSRKIEKQISLSSKYLKENSLLYERLELKDFSVYKQANYLYLTSGYPVYTKSGVAYLKLGEEYFSHLLEDLKCARKYIFMEYFIVSKSSMWTQIYEVLEQKSKEGVRIFLMTDEIGSFGRLPKGFKEGFSNSNIKVSVFNSITPILSSRMNYRDHRKIVVIDGMIAYTGGINIGDEYINLVQRFGHWKDVGVRISGSAVDSYVIMFLRMWNLSTKNPNLQYGRFIEKNHQEIGKGYVIPYADGPDNLLNPARNLYLQMINSAKKSIYIMTPYLILDNEIVTALVNSRLSGVDVCIITPHIPDKKIVFACTRSFYQELLEAGIHIYEYKSGFVHAKICLVDNEVATVGSVNFDFRSFYLHYECGLWMYECGIEKEIKKDFTDMIQQSIEITLNSWKKRSFVKKVIGAILRIIAPLL